VEVDEVEWLFIHAAFHQSGFSSNGFFHRMGGNSSTAQLFLIFKNVSRISVALLHQKLLMI
jgi:hypothetical protein